MPDDRKRKHHKVYERERSPFQGNGHSLHDSKRARKAGDRHYDGEESSGRTESASLSVEDTNALRASLGLAPLETGDDSSHRDNQSDNYVHLPAKDLRKIRETEQLKERIKTQKEKRQLYEKYGKNQLVDSSEKDVPVMSWVEKIREREKTKKLAQERDKLLLEMDEQCGVSELVQTNLNQRSKPSYESRDLSGLKVEHKSDRFAEGSTVILTLKDKGVLEEDESDVLVNVNIVDDEKADENRENLRKTAGLAGIADEESEDVLLGLRSKGVLEKYDAELQGTKKQQFTLGSHGAYDLQHERAMQQLKTELENGRQSLPDNEFRIASEYFTPEEMDSKFKKRKRRVKTRVRSALTADSLDVIESTPAASTDLKSRSSRLGGDVEGKSNASAKVDPDDQALSLLDSLNQQSQDTENVDYGDVDPHEDDELRNELERTINRVINCKSTVTVKPEEVAAQLLNRQPPDSSETAAVGVSASGGAGVVFDATAEFYKSIGTGLQESIRQHPAPRIDHRHAVDKREEREITGSAFYIGKRPIAKKDEEFSRLGPNDADSSDDDNGKPATNRWQTVDGRDASGKRIGYAKSKSSVPSTNRDEDDQEEEGEEEEEGTMASENYITGVLDDEPRLDTGVFSALQLAEKKGYLEKGTTKRSGAGALVNLMAKNFVQEDVRYDDIDAKFAKRDRYSGPLSEFKELKQYKPDVKLEYVDDLGRQLNAKEAFRQLSHKFHGKGSSKNKTEKRMKKIKEEFLLKASTSSDTPLGTAEKLNRKLQSIALPYVILSGKNAAVKNLTK